MIAEEKALARIQIQPLEYYSEDNILDPYHPCYVITTAGQIWDVNMSPWGLDKEKVKTAWNTKREKFRKREITTPIQG